MVFAAVLAFGVAFVAALEAVAALLAFVGFLEAAVVFFCLEVVVFAIAPTSPNLTTANYLLKLYCRQLSPSQLQ